MLYAKVVNGVLERFPYTLPELKSDNPNISFSGGATLDDVAEFGVVAVTQQPDPAFNAATHRLVQGTPVLSGSDWVVTRVVTALTAAELTAVIDAADRDAIRADAAVLSLLQARPAQINSYIATNVTDLNSAKEVLKILARALAVVAQATLR